MRDNMKQILEQASTCKVEHSNEAKREFLMASVRCARARVQMLALGIDEVGVALKFKMVAPEVAVGWMQDIGALQFLNPDWFDAPAVTA